MGWAPVDKFNGIMIGHRYLLSCEFYSPLPSLMYSADGAGHFQIRYSVRDVLPGLPNGGIAMRLYSEFFPLEPQSGTVQRMMTHPCPKHSILDFWQSVHIYIYVKMAHFLRGKQAGIKKDFSVGIDPDFFAVDQVQISPKIEHCVRLLYLT